MPQFLAICSIIGYLAAAVLFSRRLAQPTNNPAHNLPVILLGSAIILHLMFAWIISLDLGQQQRLTMTDVISLLSLTVSIGVVLVHKHVSQLLFVPAVAGFSAVSLLLTLSIPGYQQQMFEQSPAMLLHILLSVSAYAVLVIAWLQAIQIKVIAIRLKNKSLHSIGSVPSLLNSERLCLRIHLIGTLLLVSALGSGALFNEAMFVSGFLHKTVLACFALVVFTLMLIKHWVTGLTIYGLLLNSSLGVMFLTLSYFGSRFVKEVLL